MGDYITVVSRVFDVETLALRTKAQFKAVVFRNVIKFVIFEALFTLSGKIFGHLKPRTCSKKG
jgi:hypothetical protein